MSNAEWIEFLKKTCNCEKVYHVSPRNIRRQVIKNIAGHKSVHICIVRVVWIAGGSHWRTTGIYAITGNGNPIPGHSQRWYRWERVK